jgi:uncharacterized Actinobacterial protein TIGR03083
MADRADQLIGVLRTEFDELAARVRSLSEEDLARVSGAAEWDVSQVLSHLGSGAEISLRGLEGAIDGTGTAQRDFIRGVWARWDGMSRAERAERFLTAHEALQSRLEGLDERTKTELRIEMWYPVPPQDVAGFTLGRLCEFAYHHWDVKVTFDPAATISPAAVEPLLGRVPDLFGLLGKPEGLGGRKAAITVRLGDPERSFGLYVGDKVTIGDVPAEPDGVLTAPAEYWLRLAYGRHRPEHTPATVEFSSDAFSLDDLRRVFPGI